MNNKVFKNSIYYTIGSILPKITAFILLPIYTKYLTPEEYGITQSMMVLTSILAVFFTLATERSMFRLYYDYENLRDKKQLIANLTVMIFIISTIGVLLLLLNKNITQNIYTSISFKPYYYFAIFTAYILVFKSIPLGLLMIKGKALPFIVLNSLNFLVNTSLVLYFVVFKTQGAEGMLKGQMVGHLITLPLYLFILLRNCYFKLDISIVKNSFSFSLPMIPILISSWVLNMSDRIFIEKYFTLEEVGLYSIAYRIANVIDLLSAALFMAYSPFFYETANTKENAKKILSQYNTIISVFIVIVCFTISFLSREIIGILVNERYFSAYTFIPILSLAYCIHLQSGLLNPMIYQEKKTLLLMIIILNAAVVNILMNFLLIPKYGGYGAAWATVIAVGVQISVEYYFARRCFFIPFQFKKIFLVLLPLSGLVVFGLFFNNINLYLSLTIKIIILLIISILFYYQNKEKIIKIVRFKQI